MSVDLNEAIKELPPEANARVSELRARLEAEWYAAQALMGTSRLIEAERKGWAKSGNAPAPRQQ